MSVTSVGFDLGSSKCVIVADDGEIVLTDTGGISRPNLVSFVGRTRLVGEEAAAQANADNTVRHLNLMLEQSSVEILQTSPLYAHRSLKMSSNSGRTTVQLKYNDENIDLSVTSLLGMFLAHQNRRINAVYFKEGVTNKPLISFVLPPNATTVAATTIKQACHIAGVELDRVITVNKAECLKIAYTRKLHALNPADRNAIEHKKVIVIEMGHTQSTAILMNTNSLDPKTTPLFAPGAPTVLSTAYDPELGALHFDIEIFKHFAGICKAKHQTEVTPGSKRGKRLLAGCERVRKLLSQIPDANVIVENLTDNGDINFALTRDDLQKINAPLLERFRIFLRDVLLKDLSAKDIAEIVAIDVLGGGMRMQIVQNLVADIFRENRHVTTSTGIVLGAKLDDGSVALGASLISTFQNVQSKKDGKSADGEVNGYNTDPTVYVPLGNFALAGAEAPAGVVGFTADEITALVAKEQAMQEQDLAIEKLLAARNNLESYILECRAMKRHKYGGAAYIDAKALDKLVDECETWMYDEPGASLDDVNKRNESLRRTVENDICPKYFAAVEAEKLSIEAAMNAEAEKAAAEKSTNPEDDDDVDNRKLKKADRMRLVLKNKQEGTEVFNGGVYKTAAARYQKALTHTTKFVDLSPADVEEVKQLKISLYLNVAMCYLKMDKPDFVVNNCNFALELDARNAKALYRRSAAWEAKKDLEKALEDAKAAQAESVIPDKAINATVVRLTKEIAKAKDNEKKMWGKAFSK